jgi:hypothetical protein
MVGRDVMDFSYSHFRTKDHAMNLLRRVSVSVASLLTIGLLVVSAVGCNDDQIDRVQTNLVPKELFEGEWWYGQTIVGVDSDETFATAGGSFEGAMAFVDLGLANGDGFTPSMPRIRWVIDEEFLFAYRAYELVDGGSDDGDDEDYRGQPLAAFRVDHVDIRQQYNQFTGEPLDVRVENTSDRRWHERDFLRVDWSQNVLSTFYDVVNEIDYFGRVSRESAPFDIEPGSEFDQLPEEWQPQFVTIGEDTDYRFRDEWELDEDTENTVHYFSIVNNEMVSPGSSCLFLGLPCQTAVVTVRHAFLRVPPNHEFQAETQTHLEFDKFGTFRSFQRTFVRGGEDQSTLAQRCTADADCTNGGACNLDTNTCEGGLTEAYNETDFLAFYRPRHNLWRNQLSDVDCQADWQCDGRWEDTPGLGFQSQCDLAAQKCTNPFTDASGNDFEEGCTDCQQARTVTYHLSKHFPVQFVKTAFRTMGTWNEVFMEGRRAQLGLPAMDATGPDGVKGTADDVRIACQEDNPTTYCFCGSPEEVGGTCAYRYDPFEDPAAVPAGVVAPYDCHVVNTAGWEEPARPSSLDDYPVPDAYQFEFVGDECAFILKTNSCDLDPEQACEELGDIRYQFFNYVDQAFLRFGGVAIPLMDPTTGELVSSNVNMAAFSLERVGTRVLEYLPFLRGEDPDIYVEGENIRQYFANLGRLERPEAIGFLGDSGVAQGDQGRPEDAKFAAIFEQMENLGPRIDQLTGSEGRAALRSDRLLRLEDTEIERRLLRSMGQEYLLHTTDPDRELSLEQVASETAFLNDHELLEDISPYRGGLVGSFLDERQEQIRLSSMNYDPEIDVNLTSQYWQYWADIFADRPDTEASLRLQQAFLYGVMLHEVGHGVGLMHNFAGSFDRDHYPDPYFEVVTNGTLQDQSDDTAFVLPDQLSFDLPSRGGNGNGVIDEDESDAYLDALQQVRQNRFAAGLGNNMVSSIMEYPGDLSYLQNGLGRYDRAATLWNHFNLSEAFSECEQCSDRGQPFRDSDDDTLDGIAYSHVAPRTLYPYYRGGESCIVEAVGEDETRDVGCPFGEDSAAVTDVPWHQRCISNPRNFQRGLFRSETDAGEPCGAGERNCVCSSSDQDIFRYQIDQGGTAEYFPVDYLYCHDRRINDLSWCSTGDAGESFMEAVDHWRTNWYDTYPMAYYRRFRRTNRLGGTSRGMMFDAGKIYQHWLYRFIYEQGFRSDAGPLGVIDQYDASVLAMNWMMEIATLPDAGVYQLNEEENVWRQVSSDFRDIDRMDPDGSNGMVALGPGQGFPMWTAYQDGHQGFFRVERSGVFFDKFFAIFALATRDWGIDFTLDERLFFNFFEFFRFDVTEFFGGIIQQDPTLFAPRLTIDEDGNPVVSSLSYNRGGNIGLGGRFCTAEDDPRGFVQVPCGRERDEIYPAPAVEAASNEILRDWATTVALAEFPDDFDPSFERQLFVNKVGAGDQFDLPDSMKRDGSPGCAYGDTTLNPVHVTECESPDYVVYTPDNINQSYVAVQVRDAQRSRDAAAFEQIGYNLLVFLHDLQEQIRDKQQELQDLEDAGGDPVAIVELQEELRELRFEQQSRTSYLDYLLSLQDRFGITAFFLRP